MKKIACVLMIAALMVTMIIPAMAASSKVTVNNSNSTKGGVSYTYDGVESVEKSIKSLMTKLNAITKSSAKTQTLTVTSENTSDKSVDFALRLYLPAKKSYNTSDYNALNYYNIKVTGEDGRVIYDYAEAPETDEKALYKDIPLGTLNTEKTKESKTYNVTVSLNGDITDRNTISTAKNLDWAILSSTNDRTKETPAPTTEATDKPESTPTAAPTTAPSATPKAKSDKNGIYNLTAGEYEIGKDIDADTYTMTGNGPVDIYDEKGNLERTVVLKNDDDTKSQGSSEYVVKLEKGEKISVQNNTKLTPYTKPTATPKATTTPNKSGTSSTNSSGTTKSKSNPQTGDNAPVGIVTGLGILAMVGVVALGLKKKNK